MKQSIAHIALVVRDYDEAIQFYTDKLNFTLVEDTYQHHRVAYTEGKTAFVESVVARALGDENESQS